MKKSALALVVVLGMAAILAGTAQAARYMETLNRGVVAVYVSGSGVYVGWRMFGTDPAGIGFNVYRNGVKVNGSSPITASTNYMDAGGLTSSTYYVRPVIGGVEQAASETVSVWGTDYLSVPLQIPAGVTTPDSVTCTYSANDCSVGDLDGDGQYEIVLKWDPSNSRDNPSNGYSGNVYLDGYELNGTRLWRIDLGINIRGGAHYTQFMVYDLDGDGRAEVACKTAPGTKDGLGDNVILNGDDPAADYRDIYGKILTGPEYLTIFNGQTGAAMVTTAFPMPRGSHPSDWGDKSDTYGNRVDRFLACVAYLDGVRPSLVMCRGYYGPQSGWTKAKHQLAAMDWRNGQLTQRWVFTATTGTGDDVYPTYIGEGNHNVSVADVDGDGYDEIAYGGCMIDHDGTGVYATGLGHGDAMHLSDMNPDRPGLEIWRCLEWGGGQFGAEFRDAATGEVLIRFTASDDTGRAGAADIDPRYRGYEMWSAKSSPLYSSNGTTIGTAPTSMNFMCWWDGDLLRELLDSNRIDKWNYSAATTGNLLTASGCSSNNGTKSTPCLSADILGDWREEAVWRTTDSSALRIYTTTATTSYRIYTLMHDPVYRMGIAWQNVAYNQPPHPGFYLGSDMTLPAPTPDITLVVPTAPDETPPTPDPMTWAVLPYATSGDSITMTADTAADASGIEYYFTCSAGGGHDSGWQVGTTYTDIGLNLSATYTYAVKARDKSPLLNETDWSQEAGATTLAYMCQNDPNTDMNADCQVNFLDYALFAEALAAGNAGGKANFNGDAVIDMIDMAMMIDEWLTCGRDPIGECWIQ